MDASERRLSSMGTAQSEGERGAGAPALYLVHVRDTCCESLAGRERCDYDSPPQPLADARALVGLLIGRSNVEEIRPGAYAVPVAGGRRTIVLEAK
jgi:hypothetical protein